jgi:uncharacterized membrane protein
MVFGLINIMSTMTNTVSEPRVASFREKAAWAALLSILLGFGAYFATLAYGMTTGRASPDYFLGLLVAVVVLITVAMALFGIVVAVRAPEEAKVPADERDRTIQTRSTQLAYYVLLVGTLAAAGSSAAGVALFWILNGLLAAVVLAEVIRYGAQIVLYRRG